MRAHIHSWNVTGQRELFSGVTALALFASTCLPLVVAITTIGVYAINGNVFELYLALGFGVLGYVFTKLGRLPRRGDRIVADGYEVRVESVRENRIVAVRIHSSATGEFPRQVDPSESEGRN